MPEQPKLWEEPEPAGRTGGHRLRHQKAEPALHQVQGTATPETDKTPDNVPLAPLGVIPDEKVDYITEMVGALTDPLIVFLAGGWEHDLPEELKKRLPLDRLAHQMKCLQGQARWDEACDLEALLYMYPLTLAHPISEQGTRIYLYLGTKVMGQNLPDDIRQEALSDYDMAELRGLKRWIQKQKVKARRERMRAEKAEKVDVVAARMEQFKLF